MRIFLRGLRPGWMLLVLCLALLVGFSSCVSLPLSAQPTPTISPVARTVTPTPDKLQYQPFKPLLAKVLATGSVYVTGDQSVPDEALKVASDELDAMLRHRPDLGAILRQYGTFTVVASRNERICDLPYFSQFDSALCKSYGEGGAGGVSGYPITACDEKNLLQEPDDPYQRGASSLGQNICVHELAHTIMNVGLSQGDRDRIDDRYLAAKQEGLWAGDYAMTNDLEFWAVMSQFYFSAGPNGTYSPTFNHVANGPDALKQYDPATFALLDALYQGSTALR
jgi:hypothetical protein